MKAIRLDLKNTQNVILKRVLVVLLVVYSLVTTIGLLKLQPKTVLIAIEATGTRIVDSNADRALQSERETFIRRFIGLIYSYDQESFDDRISKAGDLMSAQLWISRKEEFTALSQKLKNSEIQQSAKLLDLREIDPEHYQADILVSVKRRLENGQTKIRLDLTLKPTKRAETNPYDMEVTEYAENSIN